MPTNDAPQRATSTGTLNSSAKKPTAHKEEDDATDYQRSQSMVGLKPKTSNPSSPSQPQTSQSVTSLNRWVGRIDYDALIGFALNSIESYS